MPKPKDWISFAEGDLIYAKLGLLDERTIAGIFYHCQQCAEKVLKAYLLFKKRSIHKTHDLEFLIEQCIEIDKAFNDIVVDVLDLNPYSTATRYPDDYYMMPSLDTAEICIKKAERILEFVKSKIL